MQQVEWNIPASVFTGLNTKYDPLTKYVGPDDFITGSHNYDLTVTGNITKRSKTTLYNATPLDHPIKDEFEMIFANSTRHKLVMSNGSLYYTIGDGIFHLVHAGYAAAGNMEFASQENRVYFGNGIDTPQVYDIGASYGGVTYTPPTVSNMGVIAPITAPTVGTPTSGGSVPAGAHTYKYTFLYYDSEESNGSPASGAVTISTNQTVPLTGIAVGGFGVTARNIYRDDNDGNWDLVGTINNNTATTFTDTAALGTLPIPIDNNVPPNWSIITYYRDRLWVAGVAETGNTLYYSDAGLPDSWPQNNFLPCNQKDTITGLTVFNDKVYVYSKSSFGIILGTDSTTFRYLELAPNIGCVDCRSIQIVTIGGVPKLQWLSQFGVYQWDGSNLQLISDKITDLLQFNIQQSQGSFNKNIQNTFDDFIAGTQTPGVDLITEPGTITTRGYMEALDALTLTNQPSRAWQKELDWESGSDNLNLQTIDNLDQVSAIPRYAPSLSVCALNNVVAIGDPTDPTTRCSIPIGSDFNGSNNGPLGNIDFTPSFGSGNINGLAIPFTVIKAGVVDNISMIYTSVQNMRMSIYTDASGQPGTPLTGLISSASQTFVINLSIAAGTYWAVLDGGPSGLHDGLNTIRAGSQTANIHAAYSLRISGTDRTQGYGWVANANFGYMSFTFTQSAIPATGSFATPVYDTKCVLNFQALRSTSQSLGSGGRIITTIFTSNDITFATGVTSYVYDTGASSPSDTITGTNQRYWFTITNISVTDDRILTSVAPTQLLFDAGGAAEWTSEAIDHTTDIISLDSLLLIASIPATTVCIVTIATSSDNITYSSFVAIGSAVPRRYSKIRLFMVVGSSGGQLTPQVTSITLNWSITSTFTSSAITTIITPTQWGIFQAGFSSNGGTVVFQTRSATTEGGLTSASWTTVSNGDIIPSTVNLWIQWRVTITSHVNQVPEINSVIVHWLNIANTGIRVASLFYNQTYYLAAAEFNSLTNNIVLYYDKEGRWGQYSNLTINTMGTFYNKAYYGDSLVGNYNGWLDTSIISTQEIEVDIRSKAYSSELISDDLTKTIRHLIVECDDSLASITPSYSVDNGNTWNPMVDIVTGLTNFTGSGTTQHRKIRFTPQAQNIVSGYSLIVRLYNNDQYPVNIVSMRCKANISNRPVLLR